MCCEIWLNIATIASPIVGVAAIIVALIISHRSSRDAQKQIDALQKQIDAYKVAQAPDKLEQFEQYKKQLEELDEQIEDAQQKYEVVNPFLGRGGAMIDDLIYLEDKKRQENELKQLKNKRKHIVKQIQLIESFLEN